MKGIGATGALPFLARSSGAQVEERLKSGSAEPAGHRFVRDQLFDDGWKFFRGDPTGAESTQFDDSGWRRVDLPHDWSIEDVMPGSDPSGEGTIWVGGSVPIKIGPFDMVRSVGQEATGWVVGGTGWYRKHFRCALGGEQTQVEIRFDGVYMNAEVWINGHSVGRHPYGYTSFAYDLTPFLKGDIDTVLAVSVRNEGANSRWYSGSGIYMCG